jgi:hypothetical protein
MEDKYQKSERPERRETKERSYQRKERTDIIFGVHSVLCLLYTSDAADEC